VASPITHAFVGAALPTAVLGRKAGVPITLVSIVCSISPDLDKVVAKVLQKSFAFTLAPIWSERGISHSSFFALLLGFLAASLAVRRRWSSERWRTLFLLFFCVTVSHGLIDVFVGTNGVALLAPFSTARYLHPIAAIPTIGFWQYFTPALGQVLLQEVLRIWLPLSVLFVLIGVAVGWTRNPKDEKNLVSRPFPSVSRGRRVAEERREESDT
jgi:inner membrane protein